MSALIGITLLAAAIVAIANAAVNAHYARKARR